MLIRSRIRSSFPISLLILGFSLALAGDDRAGNGLVPGAITHGVAAQAQAGPDTIVYVTRTGTKYHRTGCRSLAKSAIPMALKDAAAKYGPCGVCKPPILSSAAPKAEAVPLPSTTVTKAQPAGNGDVIVYVTKTGTKYHRAGCRSLSRSSIPMPLKEAAKRYSPCSICKPPILKAPND